jgi:hypothetical protein
MISMDQHPSKVFFIKAKQICKLSDSDAKPFSLGHPMHNFVVLPCGQVACGIELCNHFTVPGSLSDSFRPANKTTSKTQPTRGKNPTQSLAKLNETSQELTSSNT